MASDDQPNAHSTLHTPRPRGGTRDLCRRGAGGTASFELEAPDLAETLRRFAAIRALGMPYLAALGDGHLAGYAYAGPYRTRPAYRHTLENSVYVASWARRRGVGRLLLDRLSSEATAAGGRQMVAVIGDCAHVASIRLHEQAGFRTMGTLADVGFKLGRWLDTVIMQRPLGDGAGMPPRAGVD